MNKADIRAIVTDSLCYWERMRIVYNLLLLTITITQLSPVASHLAPTANLTPFVFLAVVANILYCSAYIPDIFIQISFFRDAWRRWRWLLLLFGCLIAGYLTYDITSSIALLLENRA